MANAKQTIALLESDARAIRLLSDKFKYDATHPQGSEGTTADIMRAHRIVLRWKRKPIYKQLGIEGEAKRRVNEAERQINHAKQLKGKHTPPKRTSNMPAVTRNIKGFMTSAAATLEKFSGIIRFASKKRGKSTSLAQKEVHVLKAAKSYRVKGGSTRQLVGELRRDSAIIDGIAKKFKAGRGTVADVKKALGIVRKRQTHPLYRALGIERKVARHILEARGGLMELYATIRKGDERPDIISSYGEDEMVEVADEIALISKEVRSAYHKQQKISGYGTPRFR